ncbi:MAG: hypothetical protein H0U75_02010 [Legionella sp.]|nr:hypothetical protein [Legionella sp.]
MALKRLVFCIDIDETLINSKTEPFSIIDFNGSAEYNDASAWVSFLDRMIDVCKQSGFSLIIQIISSKEQALPDDTVEHVMHQLRKFLPELNKAGDPLLSINFETYTLRRHLMDNHQEDGIYKFGMSSRMERYFDPNVLPPIHLCFNNKPKTGTTSKAWVMKSIMEHFTDPIPPENIFLLDNQLYNLEEVAKGSFGTTPCFQIISARSLEQCTESTSEAKQRRTKACLKIFKQCERKLLERMEYVCAFTKSGMPEHKTELPVLPGALPVLPKPASYFKRLSLQPFFQQTAFETLTPSESFVVEDKSTGPITQPLN